MNRCRTVAYAELCTCIACHCHLWIIYVAHRYKVSSVLYMPVDWKQKCRKLSDEHVSW